jgi:O-antigen/teichoic acid export membrane protein
MFLGLSPSDYGFWALVWSVFGYTMLLDFGFGTALQKATAESLAHQQWGRYQQILATVLWVYVLMGGIIALASVVLAPYLIQALLGPAATHYVSLFILFGCGTALVFPTGFAAELLRGLQAIHGRNLIQGGTQLLQLVASLWVLHQGLGLFWLTWVTLASTLLGNILMLLLAQRLLPPLRLQRPDWKLLKEMAGFSAYAYLITLTNLLIFRTDQLVIGAYLGLAAIAGYQIANRLADLFRQLTTQMHDYLGPLAARQFAAGGPAAVRATLLLSNRWMHVFAVPAFVVLGWHLPAILSLWLNLKEPAVIASAYLLLTSMFVQVTLRSSSTQILLMCQQQRILAVLAVIESLANLGLSIYLVQSLGLIGVAWGTLLPNLLLSLVGYLPLTLKHTQTRGKDYWQRCIWPAYRAGLMLLALYLPLYATWRPANDGLSLIASVVIMSVLAFASTYFLALNLAERSRLKATVLFYSFRKHRYNKQHV